MKKLVKWLLIIVVLICLFCATALASDPNNFVVADPNVGPMPQPGPVKLVPWFRVSVSADGVLEVKYGNGLILSQVARIFFYEQVKPLADQYIQRRRQEIAAEFSIRWERFLMPIVPIVDSNALPAVGG